jgi:hypothetical protein
VGLLDRPVAFLERLLGDPEVPLRPSRLLVPDDDLDHDEQPGADRGDAAGQAEADVRGAGPEPELDA